MRDAMRKRKPCGTVKASGNTRPASMAADTLMTCIRCGKLTPRTSNKQKYCPECALAAKKEMNRETMRVRRAAMREKEEERRCPVCGKTFTAVVNPNGQRKIYCSVQCKNKYHRLSVAEATKEDSTPETSRVLSRRKCPDCKRPLPFDWKYYRCERCRAKWQARHHVTEVAYECFL